jgi:glutamate-1-semialdehyde aminotransferase
MQQNFLLNEGYQNGKTFFDKGDGQYIFSKKKKFLDLSCCAGTLLLGHNSKIFKSTINSISKNKVSNFAALNYHASNYSRTLKKILPNFSKFIMCNSGTEAVGKGLRICRAITKKRLIISVEGSWHGSADETLYVKNGKYKKKLSDGLYSQGDEILFIPYNNIELSKKILDKNKKKIMCILIEPIQACLPLESAKKYLRFLYNYSKKNNLILFFDEMITGLRSDGKSVQQLFNIKPNISTFGKCFGGGAPLGFVALENRLEKKLKKNNLKIFFGGTFSGNSLSMYIANNTLQYIKKNQSKIFKKINKLTSHFEEKLNIFFEKNKLDLQVIKFKSMARIIFSSKIVKNRYQRDFLEVNKNNKINKFKSKLLRNKIFYPGNGTIFFNFAMNLKDINYLIKVIQTCSKDVFNEKK